MPRQTETHQAPGPATLCRRQGLDHLDQSYARLRHPGEGDDEAWNRCEAWPEGFNGNIPTKIQLAEETSKNGKEREMKYQQFG